MKDIFIADAHLKNPSHPNYRRFLEFLEAQRGQVRTLYLLGDIFDFWIGYRHCVFSDHIPVLEGLRKLTESGASLVYVEGNHDFHLGPYFTDVLGARVLTVGDSLEVDGQRIHISHGDLLNPEDRGYRILRKVLRHPLFRGIVALAPPDWTWGVAQWASRRSGRRHKKKSNYWTPLPLLQEHAARRFAEGNSAVVTGHFHYPHLEQSEGGLLIALGDWIEQYSYLVLENGEFSLHSYAGSERVDSSSACFS